jgi:hypothetical protein
VNSWVQVAENPQVGCRNYLDLGTITSSSGRLQQDEALQEWRIHHREFLYPAGQPNEHAPEAVAAEMDAPVPDAGEREGLQNGADGQQVIHVQFSDVDAYQIERPEVGKSDAGAAGEVDGEIPGVQGEALERGAAEDLDRKVGQLDLGELVEEGEFLGPIRGEEARPAGELTVQGGEPAVAEADGAEGARVVVEDSGDGGGDTLAVAEPRCNSAVKRQHNFSTNQIALDMSTHGLNIKYLEN